MPETFGERLHERLRARGPLCAGVDPSARLLADWGRDDSADGVEYAALALLEAVRDVATAIKAQVAHFERFGAAGFAVLERLIVEARDADVLVVADAKRGDIGVSNAGYAEAWLSGRSPLAADALTAHPYHGVASLAPLVQAAREHARGVFVLSATSNEEGRALQRARTDEGERVEAMVLREVAALNGRADGQGAVGVVYAANRAAPEFDLATLGGPILVPGVGAQGATPADLARLFPRCPPDTVLVNVGRALAQKGPEIRALRDGARRWRDDLLAALP